MEEKDIKIIIKIVVTESSVVTKLKANKRINTNNLSAAIVKLEQLKQHLMSKIKPAIEIENKEN